MAEENLKVVARRGGLECSSRATVQSQAFLLAQADDPQPSVPFQPEEAKQLRWDEAGLLPIDEKPERLKKLENKREICLALLLCCSYYENIV